MYVCPLPGNKQCEGYQWKDEINSTPETQIKQDADVDGTNDREATPTVGSSTMTPPASPPERPLPPTGNYVCWCKPPKPALQQFQKFREDRRPEDVNKYYYICPVSRCHYWRRIESDADALKRINTRKLGLGHKQYDVVVKCRCRQPASWDVARQGQYAGKAFYACRYWKLEEELFDVSLIGIGGVGIWIICLLAMSMIMNLLMKPQRKTWSVLRMRMTC
jgi:hypothetical protein